jgi:hypothetical protein
MCHLNQIMRSLCEIIIAEISRISPIIGSRRTLRNVPIFITSMGKAMHSLDFAYVAVQIPEIRNRYHELDEETVKVIQRLY